MIYFYCSLFFGCVISILLDIYWPKWSKSWKLMHFGIIVSSCLYISLNIGLTALDKGLAEYLWAAIINLAWQGCLWNLGVQALLGSFLFSPSSTKLNLFLKIVVSSDITWLLVYVLEYKWYLHWWHWCYYDLSPVFLYEQVLKLCIKLTSTLLTSKCNVSLSFFPGVTANWLHRSLKVPDMLF